MVNPTSTRLTAQQANALSGNQLVQISASDLAVLLQTKQTQLRLEQGSELVRDFAQQVTQFAVANGCEVEVLLIDNIGG